MDVRHDDPELQRIEADPDYEGRMDRVMVRAIRKVLMLVRSARNEVMLRQHRGLNFEKLKGNRQHQYSLRLNDQWRLIVEIEKGEGGNTIVVKNAEDYH